MKKLLLCLSFLLIPIGIVKAQDKNSIRNEKNPFSEARFSYFKETLLLFNEYLDTKNGSFNTTNLRLLKPIGNRAWTLRVDLPLVSANTNATNKTGLGDLSIATSFIPILTQKSGIATRIKLTTNSAIDPKFGQGKWIVAPAIFYGRFIDQNKKLLLIADAEYQYSFAGSDNRATVSIAVLESTFVYSFSKNWMSSNVAFRYNEVRKGFQNSTFIEFGRKFTPSSLFYIHPSAAFGKQKAYNYGFELGLVILF
ncbi:lipid A phosphoethanolamine transferase [Flavobacterium sp. TSSA_36]|jgi:hypothetical protein|uniref:lipid A phosphoethanolamine transferase n=1 Tax=Flavobacterium sp. TSSA_36 TaxID=3447669 RepID=UPI003F38F82B